MHICYSTTHITLLLLHTNQMQHKQYLTLAIYSNSCSLLNFCCMVLYLCTMVAAVSRDCFLNFLLLKSPCLHCLENKALSWPYSTNLIIIQRHEMCKPLSFYTCITNMSVAGWGVMKSPCSPRRQNPHKHIHTHTHFYACTDKD